MSETTINVSSKSATGELAESILNALENQNEVKLKAIGAGAVNQAVKGIAVASQRGINLKSSFAFFSVTIEGMEKSGIIISVEKEED